jgi:hypothetical protein
MTQTVTEAPAAAQDALPDTYAIALGFLATAPTREDKAQVLDQMAAIASTAARALTGHGTADTSTDPLAWHETASMLLQLSAALRGHRLTTDEVHDDDYLVRGPWKNLSCALSATEFALAFGELDAYYTRQLGDSRGRQWFALLKLREAGRAAILNWPAQRG